MVTTYKVGQAPWETSSTPTSFAVGQAPWELNVTPETPEVTPKKSLFDKAMSYPNSILNAMSDPIVDAAKKVVGEYDKNTNPLSKGVDIAGDIAGGVVGVFGGAINAGIVQPLATANSYNPIVSKIANSNAYGNIADASTAKVNQLTSKWTEFATANPEVAKKIEDAGNIAQFMALFIGDNTQFKSKLGGIANKSAAATKEGVGNVTSTIGETARGIKNKVTPTKPNDLQIINENIMPKPTAGQARLAESQGRLIPGKEPTLFKAGTADQIAPTNQQTQSTFTIKRLIPDAAKMDEPTLYTTMGEKISETAKALKPEMQKVPIKPETIGNITNEWATLKKAQLEDPYIPSDVNVQKMQLDFETRLQKSASGSMDDLWETRKAYDNSVPDNVKRANNMSSDSLQAKKEMWLQNREILNNAINDSKSGMGKTSQQAFSDMTDLYSAQTGIISKAKVETAKISKFNQYLKDHPVVATALGGTTIWAIAKKLGIPLP